MQDQGHVSASELAGMLGYRATSSIAYLVSTGAIAEPEHRFCPDRRWRRVWPRDYAERLAQSQRFASPQRRAP